MENYGFVPTDILLPKNADMTKWSCVACDQYTSEPEYWQEVENTVSDSVSTLRLMLPEIYLENTNELSNTISDNMKKYVNEDIFKTIKNSFIYVQRTLSNGNIRHGLIGAIDLEVYDFSKNTKSLCRPTEATVTSRLPARVKVRSNAEIEMPHIMMLIDDKLHKVTEQFNNYTDHLEKLYDFDLMMNSGHIKGYKVDGKYAQMALDAIANLYKIDDSKNPMLYAMGDGNHSLAAAKQYYEQIKSENPKKAESHPARYALVELVNLHDNSLEFEPIFRVVFDINKNEFMNMFKDYCGLMKGKHSGQQFKLIENGKITDYTFTKPESLLTIGTIQNFLDFYNKNYCGETDYIHGEDVVYKLCDRDDRLGFIVDGIDKDSFFDVIKKDGILPRKTFSMGHACDKRFYLECRKITE